MKIYYTIEDSLKDAVCAGFDGELRHRSTIKGKDPRERLGYLCHDGRHCPFKQEKDKRDYCTYDDTARRIEHINSQRTFEKRYSPNTIEKRVKKDEAKAKEDKKRPKDD